MLARPNALQWRGRPGRRQTLVSPGRAPFEFAQRTPVAGMELLMR
jgi:hypothetical protein